MTYYNRVLKMNLPPRQSAFLWGARQTGKTSFLEHHYPNAIFYDFLKTETFLRYSKEPAAFRQEIIALDTTQTEALVVVDEVQKIPMLLDEIHYLIEHTSCQFILCGSSARKLKRQGVNLLGGRAWKYHFFPLVSKELGDLELLKIFTRGLLPSIYQSSDPGRSLQAYVEDYLTQEIQAESTVRNISYFARFLDTLRFSHGELINYSNIARDCHIDAKTVKEYFQILVDTLLGYYLPPYSHKKNREIISATPKFYLFDVGVANYLKKSNIVDLKGVEAGQSLEHFVFLELTAYQKMFNIRMDIHFWRTTTQLEVDFVLGDAEIAIEVKITERVDKRDLKGLIAFQEEYMPRACYLVCLEPRLRHIQTEFGLIQIIPIKMFLEQLWDNKILT